MDIRDRRTITHRTAEAIKTAPSDPQKTLLIYAGFATLFSLVVSVIMFLLDQKIDSTGGLSGMSTRSMLSTVRTVLMIAQIVILGCWSLGYTVATLNIARGEPTDQNTLMGGFQRFGPWLRSFILEKIFYLGIALISIQISSFLFMLTPMSNKMFALLESLEANSSLLNGGLTLTPAFVKPFLAAAAPMYILALAVFLLLFIPTHYNFRMISYRLADVPELGAMAALRDSRTLMRGNRVALFRLDLHLWWFYLAEALITLIGNGALLLNLFGIPLPFSPGASMLLFEILYLAAQFALYYFFLNRVQVTYAVAYESLISQQK